MSSCSERRNFFQVEVEYFTKFFYCAISGGSYFATCNLLSDFSISVLLCFFLIF